MTRPYGEDGEVFGFSLFLVLSNRLTTSAFSILSLLVLPHYHHSCLVLLTPPSLPSAFQLQQVSIWFSTICNAIVQWTKQDWRPAAPLYAYAAVSLSNVTATTCQYEALKYVTFPLQTLGKCAKMLPVMLWGGLIMGKRCSAAIPLPSACA